MRGYKVYSQIKIGELVSLANISIPTASIFFKNLDDSLVTRKNNRIIGLSPEAAETFLRTHNTSFYCPAIILVANLCGGVGKTTTAINLCYGLRRIISRKTPIVLHDGDPQGSTTQQTFGQMAAEKELLLIDYLEGRAALKDILTQLEDNIWVIKSNLNNASIEKLITKPIDIKNKILSFYKDIFNTLGSETKIIQDHHPDLSTFFASSVCALHQLPENALKAVLIPLRSDAFAISGGQKIVHELVELNETFSFDDKISIHCYFSNMDRRIPTSSAALQIAASKEEIVKHLSHVVIRYSDEIPKSLHGHSNVYATGKKNKSTEDFNELLLSIFNKQK